MEFRSSSLSDTQQIGEQLFELFAFPACVYLNGELGAGKTSLCQSIIHAAGYDGAVSSPTYNLIHEYPVTAGTIYHMDLYRLDDPQELEYLAIEDLWGPASMFLIEWPDKAKGQLQNADWELNIRRDDKAGEQGRVIEIIQIFNIS